MFCRVGKLNSRLFLGKMILMLLILLSFEVTFGLTRTVTYLQRIGYLPNQDPSNHIHHLVPGIFLLLISGLVGIGLEPAHKWNRVAAALFGVGAALTLDEFALWLHLQDVYWEQAGRVSIDAVIIFSVLIVIIYLIQFEKNKLWPSKKS